MQIALAVSEDSRSLACVIYPTRDTLLFKRIPYEPTKTLIVRGFVMEIKPITKPPAVKT